nr:hypothetical protein [Tanacetum cinerariifolium]
MAARGQNHVKEKNKQAYAPKPKIPPPPKREDPAKDSICHECGETGHWRRNCPQYLAELLKKKNNAASGAGGSCVFVIELNTILNRSWIYDTGYGTHICNTTQGLKASRKLKLGALSLYVGNGQREAVEHKHEVFETFKVFQKEVENQLGKTIKSLRSNRRGEYISQEFLDHLKDHEIIAHRTPPYTLQHNGVSEKRNRTLLDMVRSMMNQTTLPKSFWDYALETAARILNMVPTKKVEKTPYEVWHEKAPKLSYLKVWGYTSLNHEEDDLEIDEPQSDIVPIRRSTRTRHAPDHVCLYIDAEEHELKNLGEPANYKAALLDPESEKWLNAMNVEMQSMKDNEVWVLVELPPNGKTVGSKWLFKKKTDIDGVVHTFKAHLVEKGYTQTSGIDYEETFSPVADIRAIRILIAIAAYYDYKIWQIDVKTSLLNGYLNEEVYMEQPEGEAAYILGINFYRDRSWRLLGLCKSAYIEKFLKRYCMENSKRGSIPMQEKLKLNKSQGASTPADLKRMQNVPYASAVGFIMYVVRCTRPDVAFAQNVTSRLQQNLGDLHWTTVKNILKYLRNTKDMFLSGYVFVLNGGAVDWKSAKQSIFATSSVEAEYIAAFDASKEAVWVMKFIYGLGVVPTIEEPISMYCDNARAIAIANESGITKGARHFRAKVHYLREVIEYDNVKLEKVHTDDNLADPFTKKVHTDDNLADPFTKKLHTAFTTLVFNKEFVHPLDVQNNTLAPLQN